MSIQINPDEMRGVAGADPEPEYPDVPSFDAPEEEDFTELLTETEPTSTYALLRIAVALEKIAETIGVDSPAPAPAPRAIVPQPAPLPNDEATPIVPTWTLGQPPAPQPVTAEWYCPDHHVPGKVVPAGISRKTGRAYNAFTVCPVQNCEQRPPRGASA